MGRIVLTANLTSFAQSMFGFCIFLAVFPLCLLRLIHWYIIRGKLPATLVLTRKYFMGLRRLWLLSTVDRLFYPLVLYPLYLTFGPWFAGEIIDGYTGVTFAWGSVISGRYIPAGALTYGYGFLQMVLYQIPLVFVLSGITHQRYEQLCAGKPLTLKKFLRTNVPIFVLICIMTMFAIYFGVGYGVTAFFLGPLRTYSVVLAVVLWYHALKLPKESFKRAEQIWSLAATQQIH
ncbi:unnamed protein product [Notodromas monacha]|uniref:TMEM62 C-terminal domain-containing protein n=1 Tax=Notodromas monacha TaxID=399045 RepID=A0A7R9BHA2_9CRUS|nr:unnamed protein product [Notodromas monacha]CAG0915465.1 unnamed protein product [Notodromas monacha]